MRSIIKCPRWKAMILTSIIVAGCENVTTHSTGGIEQVSGLRQLTGIEMDQVTAGSAAALGTSQAQAVGSAPQTNTSTATLADAGGSPVAGAPFLNYSTSQIVASASSGFLVQAGGSSQTQVNGGNGGAGINAAASSGAIGSENNQAAVDIQFTGFSLSHLDFVYGSVSAVACCGSSAQAEANVDSATGGPYSKKLQSTPVSDMPGVVEQRIDAAVASSTLPLLDPGQASAMVATTSRQSISQ